MNSARDLALGSRSSATSERLLQYSLALFEEVCRLATRLSLRGSCQEAVD